MNAKIQLDYSSLEYRSNKYKSFYIEYTQYTTEKM